MPTFQIHVVNSDFQSRNAMDAPNLERARVHALKAALEIGVDEMCTGETRFFGAEIRVELDGDVKHRFMVGIGQCPLQTGSAPVVHEGID